MSSDESTYNVFVYGSKEWANSLLSYFLKEILWNEKCWPYHPESKIVVAREIVWILEAKGFFWQAERVRNHLRLWMKKRFTAAKPPIPHPNLDGVRGDS